MWWAAGNIAICFADKNSRFQMQTASWWTCSKAGLPCRCSTIQDTFWTKFYHLQGCYFVSLHISSCFDIYITRKLRTCTRHQIFFGWPSQEERDGRGMWHVWGRGVVRTGFGWRDLRKGDHLEDPGLGGRIIPFRAGILHLNFSTLCR